MTWILCLLKLIIFWAFRHLENSALSEKILPPGQGTMQGQNTIGF
jgi:hypothetical protein